jgi:hypothetical protein
MHLDRANIDPVEDENGSIIFKMSSHQGLISCRAAAEALLKLTGGRYRTLLEAFGAVRSQLEPAASRKYDSGHLHPDGGITIRSDDVINQKPKSSTATGSRGPRRRLPDSYRR